LSLLLGGWIESCSSRFFVPFVFLGILVSVIGTSLVISHTLVWSFLVIGSLSVCGWLKPKVSTDALVTYFVISVLGRLLFLVCCSGSFVSFFTLQLALTLKLGMAPFQFWVYKVLSSLRVPDLCFFLGPSKVGLLWLLVSIHSPSLVLVSASLFLGLSLLILSSSLSLVLFASGATQLLILVLLGPSSFPIYYSIYLTALLGITWFSFRLISPFFAFLGLGALPPLAMFWAKVYALLTLPLIWSCLVLVVSVLTLWPYLRCFVGLTASSASSLSHCAFLVLLPCSLVVSTTGLN